MKILNRPMFRYGGPIKEGIMNGIQEPRRIGYAVKGTVSAADQAKAFENIFTTPNNVTQEQVTQFANPAYKRNFLQLNKPYMKKTVTKPTDLSPDIATMGGYGEIEKPYIDYQKIPKYIEDQDGDGIRDINPEYTKNKSFVNDIFGGPFKRKTDEKFAPVEADGPVGIEGKNLTLSGIDEVIENRGKVDDTPLTKKERTNNILEMLGYDKAKKNALYDAMIKAGQRVSRTGLGADNLVSDVIQDTSTSYDKPEKLREAANLMDVQQQLKLDQIEASKTNKNQEDLDFYTKQFGGGEAGRKKALNFLTKQASSSVEAYLTTKKSTGSGLDGVKGAIEWMISNGDIKEGENKGEINKKKFDGLSDFLKDPEGFAKRGPGVYQLSGMVVRINADGTTETVQSFGTIDEKTSSWFSK